MIGSKGESIQNTEGINYVFYKYYSKQTAQTFLEQIDLPTLTEEQISALNAPITQDKLINVIKKRKRGEITKTRRLYFRML